METIIPLVPALLTGSSDRPGDSDGPPVRPKPLASLFGLAPCGVLPATSVARGAVRSYRTFSPLPAFALGLAASGYGVAVYFLCHWSVGLPRPGVTRRTVLLEFGLSSPGTGSRRRLLLSKKVALGPVTGSDRLVHYGRNKCIREGQRQGEEASPFGLGKGARCASVGTGRGPARAAGQASPFGLGNGARCASVGSETLRLVRGTAQLEGSHAAKPRLRVRRARHVSRRARSACPSVAYEPEGLALNPCGRRPRLSSPARPSARKSGTARASCRDCCAGCRSLRQSSRCSSCSRAVWRQGRRARRRS